MIPYEKLAKILPKKICGASIRKKSGNTILDFRARASKAHAADIDEPMGTRTRRTGRVAKVEPDGGARCTDARPGRKIGKVEDRFGIGQTDVAGEDRRILGAGPARDD